jgi:hypothetical protein
MGLQQPTHAALLDRVDAIADGPLGDLDDQGLRVAVQRRMKRRTGCRRREELVRGDCERLAGDLRDRAVRRRQPRLQERR